MNPLAMLAALTLLLTFVVVLTVRLDSRHRQMPESLQRSLSSARTFVVLGGLGWLLFVVIFANGLRGTTGVGSSELILVGVPTFVLLALSAAELGGVWWRDRRARRRGTKGS